METAIKLKWEWDDLLEMISETENKEIRTDILSDDLIIPEDFMKCKVGYKRNFQDLNGGKILETPILNSNRQIFCDSSYSFQMKRFKYS
jgi:hypothetical protein